MLNPKQEEEPAGLTHTRQFFCLRFVFHWDESSSHKKLIFLCLLEGADCRNPVKNYSSSGPLEGAADWL
jgi:hypothetical protein